MYFNLLHYYDVESIGYKYGYDNEVYFIIELCSKSTGELTEIVLTEELFDTVIEEMEVNIAFKKLKLAQLWLSVYE